MANFLKYVAKSPEGATIFEHIKALDKHTVSFKVGDQLDVYCRAHGITHIALF